MSDVLSLDDDQRNHKAKVTLNAKDYLSTRFNHHIMFIQPTHIVIPSKLECNPSFGTTTILEINNEGEASFPDEGVNSDVGHAELEAEVVDEKDPHKMMNLALW